MSETHGRADKPTLADPIDGYNHWRSERSGGEKGGGGLCIIYKENLQAREWVPTVAPNFEYITKERQWLLIDTESEKYAFLYI